MLTYNFQINQIKMFIYLFFLISSLHPQWIIIYYSLVFFTIWEKQLHKDHICRIIYSALQYQSQNHWQMGFDLCLYDLNWRSRQARTIICDIWLLENQKALTPELWASVSSTGNASDDFGSLRKLSQSSRWRRYTVRQQFLLR